jgi:AraC-like DNA-binding protein
MPSPTKRAFVGRRFTDPDEFFSMMHGRQPGARQFAPTQGAWSANVHALEFSHARIVISSTSPFSVRGGGDGFRRIFLPVGASLTLEGAGARLDAQTLTPVLLPADDWRAVHGEGPGIYFSCSEDALAFSLLQAHADDELDALWNARAMRPLARLGPFVKELWDLVCRFTADPRVNATTRSEAKHARDELLASLAEALATRPPARLHEAERAACIARAYDYVMANLGAHVRLSDVAAAAGCAPRTLQNIIQGEARSNLFAQVGVIRLAPAYARLADPEQHASVTTVAFDCGFPHLGEFGRAYLRHYGERPSDTLARARRDKRRSQATAAKKTLVSPLLR